MHINFVTDKKFSFNLDQLKNLEINNLVMVIAVGAAIFLVIASGIVQKVRYSQVSSKVMLAEKTVDMLKQKLAQEGVSETLLDKSTLLKRYDNRISWEVILSDTANSASPGVWIKSMKGTGGVLEVSGEAPNQGSVASYLATLKDVEVFGGVKLLNSAWESKINKIEFKISAVLKQK